ncbi:MAG: hypothetical protein B6I36_10135 [Desulfobacteraceae bacterium 4572_35.1]|nr:MAG: hypothetical protein B6I36_10135 [Desulfobacteraceae bacterium 4572_35.1]
MSMMNSHIENNAAKDTGKSTAKIYRGNGNIYLDNPEKGLQLCAELVAMGGGASPAHKKLAELQLVIEEKFLPLTESDYNTTGAAAYRGLKQVCTDLEALIQFPELERHYTVAVGGMFSAGKSRFLNSILGSELLPTDTNPTISIPTYLTQGPEDTVTVLNKFHQRITSDESALQAICHSFHERFKVSFAHILRLIHVQRKNMKYPQITFLDTPGYSKSDSIDKSANTDENIAREHLRQADYLIWLIDIQNGTIPSEDMVFIRSLDFKRPILFVLNKADKKTKTEISQTLNAARKDLARAEEFQVYGVTAFSSAEGVEYGDSQCMKTFFKDVSARKSGTPVLQRARDIFSNYTTFYESEKIRLRQQRGVLNEIALSTGVEKELQHRSKSLAAGSKERIDALVAAEKKMIAVQRSVLNLIEDIAELSGLVLSDETHPNLTGMIGLAGSTDVESFRFNGSMNQISDKLLQGLLRKPNLEKLSGTVRKVDSLCFYFEMDDGFEVMALTGEVQKVTGLSRKEAVNLLPVGEKVSVHLRENERCTIIYPVIKQKAGSDD